MVEPIDGPSTSPSKSVPPASGSPVIDRARLHDRLSEGLGRRLTTVVAGAGFGKSTLLSAWAREVNCAWYTLSPDDRELSSFAHGLTNALRLRIPDIPLGFAAALGAGGPGLDPHEMERAQAFAESLSGDLDTRLRRDLVLVLDDLHEVYDSSPAVQAVEALIRHAPAVVHLVISSRRELPFSIDRLRGRGQVLEIEGSELAFSPAEVAALMVAELGEDSRELSPAVSEASGGWPAAVRLTLEALRSVPLEQRLAKIHSVRAPGGTVFSLLAAEVFGEESSDVARLISIAARFDRFCPELCGALGVDDPATIVASLVRRGLFVEPIAGDPGWFSLNDLVRDFARDHYSMGESDLRSLHDRAAKWFQENGHPEDALSSLKAVRGVAEMAALLSESGDELLSAGRVEAVLRAVELLPRDLCDARIDQLAGDALQIRGNWSGALARYGQAAATRGSASAALAWRMGLIHLLRGDSDEALAAFESAEIDDAVDRDAALLMAWKATTHWRRGELDVAESLATKALDIASAVHDLRAQATAHTVLAMIAAWAGDRTRNDAHYLRALEYAESAGDALQITRIRSNRASHLMEEGDYQEALAELEIAIRFGDLAGFAAFQALALSNRGETYLHLGKLDEAAADLKAAMAVYQRMGSRMIAGPLTSLAEVHRERGEASLARAAFEDAIAHAEASDDLHLLVPALSGLARLVADDDVGEAQRLVDRALSYGGGLGLVGALLAAGWTAIASDDGDRAVQLATRAASEARLRRDRAGLAEALEIEARAVAASDRAESLLKEATRIWQSIGNPLGEARAQIAMANLRPRTAGLTLVREAEARLSALGARRLGGEAAALGKRLAAGSPPPLTIQALGIFRVLRYGVPIATTEWQSKKARDVLKMLVARRGRPLTRDAVMEALWPEEEPEKVTKRLSVALAIARAVIDPEKRFAPDHFVVADRDTIGLEIGRVEIDVEDFLGTATKGLVQYRIGHDQGAIDLLRAAEQRYAGDFLESDVYEDWAVPLREEARACYLEVARSLAKLAAASGDPDACARYLLRIIERDPYDEGAYLDLLAALTSAGRHGEARRWYRAYAERMRSIEVEPDPFPATSP